MTLTTAEIRKTFIRTFNHRFDGAARKESPDLTEEQRFLLALGDLTEAGITELPENDIVWCLANVEAAHLKRTHQASGRGSGELMSAEAAGRANEITYQILGLFVKYGYLEEIDK